MQWTATGWKAASDYVDGGQEGRAAADDDEREHTRLLNRLDELRKKLADKDAQLLDARQRLEDLQQTLHGRVHLPLRLATTQAFRLMPLTQTEYELLEHAFLQSCAYGHKRRGTGMGCAQPPKLVVLGIERVCNARLQQAYLEYVLAKQTASQLYSYYPINIGKHAIRVQTYDKPCNEFVLFHGSTQANALAANGVDLSRAHKGGLFGPGFYMTPIASKADCYTGFRTDQFAERQIVAFRCMLGQAYVTQTSRKGQPPPPSCDSVVAPGRFIDGSSAVNFPEVVVFDKNSVMPEFVITYKHTEGCACTHCE